VIDTEPFQGWCVLEVMGHRRLSGHVQEVTMAGAGFLRIDVYHGKDEAPAATQFYPPASVYCLTPTTEEAARKASAPWIPPALAAPDDDDDCDGPCGPCKQCGNDLCDCEVPW